MCCDMHMCVWLMLIAVDICSRGPIQSSGLQTQVPIYIGLNQISLWDIEPGPELGQSDSAVCTCVQPVQNSVNRVKFATSVGVSDHNPCYGNGEYSV
jgi:hypothetical protein